MNRLNIKKIKSGEGDQLWNEQPYKKRQKDIDARWTEKGGQKFYGYKDHTKIDGKSKLIDTYEVSSAEVHDGQALESLLCEDDGGQELYADSANIGEPIDRILKTKGMIGLINLVYNMCRYEQIVRLNLLPVKY